MISMAMSETDGAVLLSKYYSNEGAKESYTARTIDAGAECRIAVQGCDVHDPNVLMEKKCRNCRSCVTHCAGIDDDMFRECILQLGERMC